MFLVSETCAVGATSDEPSEIPLPWYSLLVKVTFKFWLMLLILLIEGGDATVDIKSPFFRLLSGSSLSFCYYFSMAGFSWGILPFTLCSLDIALALVAEILSLMSDSSSSKPDTLSTSSYALNIPVFLRSRSFVRFSLRIFSSSFSRGTLMSLAIR